MKRIIVLCLLTGWIVSSCNDENSKIGSDADAAASPNETTADASSADTARAASGSAATPSFQGSFMESMNKTMHDMMSMKMTQDPDHDFAMMMKRHHDGAIEMSNIEIVNGKNDEVKKLAGKIIDDSKKDNTELEAFLSSHQPTKKSDFSKQSIDKMMSQSSEMKMDHEGDADQQFATIMAMHHKHGIEIARMYLKSATAEETKKVANNTIKSNTEDIKKLEKWQGGQSKEVHKGH